MFRRPEGRPDFYVNGKWLAQDGTGTQRYATEIARRLPADVARRGVLVVPSDAILPEWTSRYQVQRARRGGVFFEQLVLPWVCRGKPLVCLGGSSPLAKRGQVLVLFDASVFRFPQTFSRRFVLWYRTLYRTARWRAKELITISQFSQSELAGLLRIPQAEIAIAPCGADHIVPRSGTAQPALRRAVVVGSLTERKNIARVVAELAADGIEVDVVGASGASHVFGAPVLGLDAPGVHVHGRLTDDEMLEIVANATALVFPSRYEGFGLPIVEAQRVGCPVIASSSSSLPEVGGDGALYFDPDDAPAAVRLFNDVSTLPALREDLVDKGFTNSDRYTWDASAQVIASRISRAVTRD